MVYRADLCGLLGRHQRPSRGVLIPPAPAAVFPLSFLAPFLLLFLTCLTGCLQRRDGI